MSVISDELDESGCREALHAVPSAERRRRTYALLKALEGASGAERESVVEELILLNRPVAWSIAGRYGGRGVAVEDLRQVACEGLVKAVRRFDPETGHDLLSYAVPTIHGEIKRHFRDLGWSVRPPRRIQELQQEIRPAVHDLGQMLAREPRAAEVAARLGVSASEYDAATSAYGCFQPASLDDVRPGRGDTWADRLEDDWDDLEAAQARLVLEPLLRRLPLRERRLLHLRFYEDLTQAEIAEALGITQGQVSRLLRSVCGSLRESLGDVALAG